MKKVATVTAKARIATIVKLKCIGMNVVATYEDGTERVKEFETYEGADKHFEYVNGIWCAYKLKATTTVSR